jgi:VCBS repeat-containing protein
VSAGPARVCTLADDTLTLLRSGHCQLEATAAGNATYLAAPAVDAAVEVTAQITDKTYTLPASAAGSGSHGATTINVLKGDHGQTLVGVTQPPHGHVKIDGTRLVVNVPAGYKGTETFTYTTQDASGRQHTATVTINVPNSPPTIESMSTKTIAGSSRHLVVPVADANHDNLTVTVGKHAGARVIVVRHRLRITPDRSFSGRLTIPVTVRDGDGGVATATVHVLVSPRPTRSASRHLVPLGTRIAWPAVPTHGARYAVTVDGRRMCVTAALSCTVGQFLGAHAHVKVTVYGLDGTRSTLTPATPHRSRPQLAGTVYFATDSSVLSRHQAAIARALARRALKYGFRSVALVGYTDSRGSLAYNEALSHRRSRTVAHLLRTGFHLSARLAWRGEGSPAATNATVQGMALNRRVELWLG